jgi:hypothetical protein
MTGICPVWYVYLPISDNSKFSNIWRETASKSIEIWPYIEFFETWCFEKLVRLTRTTRKTMEVKYFKVKHKVLKYSLHGQLWSDFEKVSLKMSGKAWVKIDKKFY